MEFGNYPIWGRVNEHKTQYPRLTEDINCSVCVVGGGVTGSLCAMRLAERGEDVVLLSGGAVGLGSTASAMPCAVYDGGESLHAVSQRHGRETAELLFSLGAEAIDGLEELCGKNCGFERRDAMLFSDDPYELKLLGREYIERQQAGFDCIYLSKSAASDVFPFPIEGAIITKGLAISLDPYKLAAYCARRAKSAGARIFEGTHADRIEPVEQGSEIQTSACRSVVAKHVVVAAGEACADIIEGLSRARTCFMTATEPLENFTGWQGKCAVRCWQKPELSLCISPDGRVCVKGLSTAAVDEQARLGGIFHLPALHEKRFSELRSAAEYIFPRAACAKFEYKRASRVCKSVDGLPIVGSLSSQPGCIFAVCSGDSGVLMSEVASEMVCSIIQDGGHELCELFSPERKSLVR